MVLDSTYHSTVIKMFAGVVPDRAINVFEEPDSGFVMFQFRNLSTPRRMFIVKVNSQGDFTTIKNNEYFTGNSLKMFIYPNPTENIFTVRFSEKVSGSIAVHDLSGRFIYEQNIEQTGETNISLKNVLQGIYIVSLINEQGKIVTCEQLVKK